MLKKRFPTARLIVAGTASMVLAWAMIVTAQSLIIRSPVSGGSAGSVSVMADALPENCDAGAPVIWNGSDFSCAAADLTGAAAFEAAVDARVASEIATLIDAAGCAPGKELVRNASGDGFDCTGLGPAVANIQRDDTAQPFLQSNSFTGAQSVTITPSDSGAKILIYFVGFAQCEGSSLTACEGEFKLQKGADDLTKAARPFMNSGDRFIWPMSLVAVDHPNSTDPVTYQLWYRGSGNANFQPIRPQGELVAVEL